MTTFSVREWRPVRFMKLMKRAFGEYAFRVVLLILLGFVSGILEGVGINSIIPLLSFFGGGAAGGAQDFITETIRRFFAMVGMTFNLRNLLILIASLFLLRSGVLLVSSVMKIKIMAGYEAKTRARLLEAFTDADWTYLMRQKLGHLETVLMTNVRNSSVVLEHLCAMIIIVTNLSVYLLVAFNISALITGMTLLLGVGLFLGLRPSFGNTKKFSHQVEAINKKIAHFLNENIYGMKTVKTMGVGNAVSRIGHRYFFSYRDIFFRIVMLRSLADVLMQPIGVLFICVLFGVYFKTGAFQIGAFAAVIYLIQRIFIYFQLSQASLRTINENAPFLQAVVQMEAEIDKSHERDSGTANFLFKRALEFRDVTFSYADDQTTLKHVGLTIKRGETVGIIGPSGSGKTTLVDLVLRLFDPSEGKLFLDGRDVREIGLSEWRKNIGYVSQDSFLMNDTIAANIKFHHSEITDQEMEEATKQADIFDFIRSLPGGFQTVMGERGTFLSGGQRQRIVIARVLARKPQLLILDEATSALDNESEAQIQNVIRSLKGKITVLMIAHRLSTVMDADKIVVLENGSIVESGSPQELLKNTTTYFYKAWHAKRS